MDGAMDETMVREDSSLFSSELASDAPQSIASDLAVDDLAANDADISAQSGFDSLSSRKQNAPATSRAAADQVKDLKLDDSYQVAAEAQAVDAETEADAAQGATAQVMAEEQVEAKRSRKEKVSLPQAASPSFSLEKSLSEKEQPKIKALLRQRSIRIETFESEVEPMEFALLDSGHFVLFRRVWDRDQR